MASREYCTSSRAFDTCSLYYGALLGRREESAQQSRRSRFKFKRPTIRSRRSVMGALRWCCKLNQGSTEYGLLVLDKDRDA